jgi:hypothetical protein
MRDRSTGTPTLESIQNGLGGLLSSPPYQHCGLCGILQVGNPPRRSQQLASADHFSTRECRKYEGSCMHCGGIVLESTGHRIGDRTSWHWVKDKDKDKEIERLIVGEEFRFLHET